MKIGIFGDSFADISYDPTISSWPDYVRQNLNVVVDNYAKSGTSIWWSYEQFLKYYKEYDVLIFSFTSANRWPHLPKQFLGKHWNIGHLKDDSILDDINKHFDVIFSSKLLDFLNTTIHKTIIDICQEENKYLIQILPFLHFNKEYHFSSYFTPIENKFPMLSGLSIISYLEEITVDGISRNLNKLLGTLDMIDYRGCHLNESNNIIIADWITNCIKEKKYDIHFKAEENLSIWNLLDVNGYEKIKRNFKK